MRRFGGQNVASLMERFGVEDDILPALQTDEFKDFGIHPVGVMEQVYGYTYFHNTHRDLVPKFEAVLKAMKAEGLIEQYRATAYGE